MNLSRAHSKACPRLSLRGSVRIAAGAVVLGAILLCAGRSFAQSAAKNQRAQKLSEAGAEALTTKDFEKALLNLEQAYRTAALPEILYQLGRVAQAQGRNLAAADLYSRYLESDGEQVDAATRDTITKYVRAISSPTATVTVTADQGALLVVDGRIAGLLPLSGPLLLGAGPHRFRLEIGSRSYESDALDVPAGRQAELRLTPGAARTAIAVLSLPPVVAVLVSPAELPTGAAELVTRAIAESLQKEHALVVPREKLLAALPQPAPACLKARDCQRTLGERTHAATVLSMQLVPDGQGGYKLHGQLLDIPTGDESAMGEDSCARCDVNRALGAARTLAVRLLEQGTTRQRGSLEIKTSPSGAEVQLDGQRLGQTPLARPAFVGDRDIRIERPGFAPIHAVLPVTVDQTASLGVELVPDGSKAKSLPLVPEAR